MVTKQASGTAKIDPLMAAFHAIALVSASPWSAQPSSTDQPCTDPDGNSLVAE